jgi:hypothetical protein
VIVIVIVMIVIVHVGGAVGVLVFVLVVLLGLVHGVSSFEMGGAPQTPGADSRACPCGVRVARCGA